MSVKAMKWAANVEGISGKEKAVLFVLAEAHNGKTGLCCPGQERIARKAGMNDKTARKYLSLLEGASLISRRVTSKGAGLITLYDLHMDVLEPTPKDTHPNGTGLPVGRDTQDSTANGIPLPVGQRLANGKELPVGAQDQTVKMEGPNGNCLPFPIEEPEGTGIYRSSEADASSERPQSDLFNQPAAQAPSSPEPPQHHKPATRRADPAEVEKEFIFKNGIQLLVSQGHTEQTARSYFGRLVRDWKIKPVAEAVKAAIAANPGDAKAWIPAALKKRKTELSVIAAPTVDAVAADDWCAAINRWVDDGYWPGRLGVAPNQVGYRGPIAPLQALLPDLGDHPVAREIRTTISQRQNA